MFSLDKVQQADPTPSNHELELSLKGAIQDQLIREQMLWRQRSCGWHRKI